MFKLLKKFRAISYYGFPMEKEAPSQHSRNEGGVRQQRGVALFITLMTIMLIVALVTDMIITSTVDLEMAVASRDRVRSEYLAKSGFNFGLLILSISWGYDLFRASPQSPMKQDLQDNGSSIWAMANKLPPIGAFTVEMLNAPKKSKKEKEEAAKDNKDGKVNKDLQDTREALKDADEPTNDDEENDEDDPFKLKGVMNEEVRNTMALFETSFSIKIVDEASKINVNECYTGRCAETIQMLTELFNCPAEKAFLESKNLQPEQLAYRIKDFITNNPGTAATSPESGFSDKNSPYLNYNPSYTTKGAPFDSIDELKLIEGWDDEIHEVFAPYLTAYPYPVAGKPFSSPININTVKPELLSCLIPDSRSQSCAESFAQKMYKLKKDNSTVFKGSIKDTLSSLTCLGSDPSLMQAKDGTKMDPTTWFDQKSSVFRIEVEANTLKQSRRLVAVIRRIMPQDKSNQRELQQVKRSYQILHWNML